MTEQLELTPAALDELEKDVAGGDFGIMIPVPYLRLVAAAPALLAAARLAHAQAEEIERLKATLLAAMRVVDLVDGLQCCEGEDAKQTTEMKQALAALHTHALSRHQHPPGGGGQ